MYYLAQMYRDGKGIKKDYNKAIDTFKIFKIVKM